MIDLPWQEHEHGLILRSRYLEARLERLPSSMAEDEHYQARIVTPDGRRWESEAGLSVSEAEVWVENELWKPELLDYEQLRRDMLSLLLPLLKDRHPLYEAWLMMIVGPAYSYEARPITPVDIHFNWRQDGLRSEADTLLGLAVIAEARGKRSAYSFGRTITYHPALLDPSGAELAGPEFTEWEDAERWLHELVDQVAQPDEGREASQVAHFLFDICRRLVPSDIDPILAQQVDELYQWVDHWDD